MGKDKRGQHEQLQSCHPRGLPVATFCPFYELKHTCPHPRVESCDRIKPPLFFSLSSPSRIFGLYSICHHSCRNENAILVDRLGLHQPAAAGVPAG